MADIALNILAWDGDRPLSVLNALRRLLHAKLNLIALSSLYRIEKPALAFGGPPQIGASQCGIFKTERTAADLLHCLQRIQREMLQTLPHAPVVTLLFHSVEAQAHVPHQNSRPANLFKEAALLVPLAELLPNLMLAGREIRLEMARLAARQTISLWQENASRS